MTPRDVPIRASSQQWHQEVARTHTPTTYSKEGTSSLSDALSDEILLDEEEEYDSSELFDDEELELDSIATEDSAVLKSVVDTDAVVPEKDDDDDDTIDILSAFGITSDSAIHLNEESGDSDKEIEDEKAPEVSILIPPPPALQPQIRQRYPQLLAPPTPPGKRVIVSEEHPASKPKAVDNHRVSYGLTAASVYARLQPTLRQRNGTGGLRQRVIPRPYKRRPITVSSTTTLPMDKQPMEKEEDEEVDLFDSDLITEQTEIETEPIAEETETEDEQEEEAEEEEEETQIDKMVEPKTKKESHVNAPEETATNQKEEAVEEAEEAPEEKSPVAGPSTIENETLKPKTSPAAPAAPGGPVDIKSLLRSAGPLSLSEILQQKGMSLAELLKGGSRVAPVIGITTTASPVVASTNNRDAQKQAVNGKVEHGTTTPPSNTKTITTTIRPDVLPSVKPISFRELLAAKNLSLQEIIQPNLTPTTEKSLLAGPTLKPGVKLPTPFSPGRAKGLAGLVAQPAPPPPEGPATESNPSSPPPQTSKPSSKPLSELKPLIFGGAKTVEEQASAETTTSSTTTARTTTSRQMVIQTKRPYLAGANVGEYGTHLGRSFEEEEDEEDGNGTRSSSSNKIGSYGMQRPIATSRLTPAPPRKQRPVLNFNYNALSEEEDDEEATTTTQAPILTHFNEEELNENHPYFDLPVSVRNAIIVSSTIGGFCLVVFLIILVVFRIRQKTRIRLRHPAALLGLGGVTDMTASNGSDSSGITTPVSHPASKSGYAKLPRRSSSLWGTLRRSVRQMESVHLNYS